MPELSVMRRSKHWKKFLDVQETVQGSRFDSKHSQGSGILIIDLEKEQISATNKYRITFCFMGNTKEATAEGLGNKCIQ